jgi:hypothetical protein
MNGEIFSGWYLALADRHLRSLKSLRDAMKLNSLSARAVNVLGLRTHEQAWQANVLTLFAGERDYRRKTMDEIARWMDHDNGHHSVAYGNGGV